MKNFPRKLTPSQRQRLSLHKGRVSPQQPNSTSSSSSRNSSSSFRSYDDGFCSLATAILITSSILD